MGAWEPDLDTGIEPLRMSFPGPRAPPLLLLPPAPPQPPPLLMGPGPAPVGLGREADPPPPDIAAAAASEVVGYNVWEVALCVGRLVMRRKLGVLPQPILLPKLGACQKPAPAPEPCLPDLPPPVFLCCSWLVGL